MHERQSANDGARRGGKVRTILRRGLPVAALVALAAAFFALGFDRYLSLDVLQTHHETWTRFVAQNAVTAAILFVGIYVVVVAASIPGALVLTITAGFLFGSLAGTALAVSGATLGAVAIFLIARTAFGEALRGRAGGAIDRMAEGFRRDAFNYLLVLRLVPLFPFFLVNLAPALLGVRLRTFAIATAIGIVPGTFVYANVGAGLGSVIAQGDALSLSGVFTPEIITAFVGLAILSLVPVGYRDWRGGKPRP